MSTRQFNLPSGVPATIKGFTGNEQRILTQKGKLSDKLTELLYSITLKIGNVDISSLSEKRTKEDPKSEKDRFFLKLLSCDRKAILAEAGLMVNDQLPKDEYEDEPSEDDMFIFTFKYTSVEDKEEKEYPQQVDLREGFPVKKVKIYDRSLVEGKSFNALKRTKDDIINTAKDLDATDYSSVVENLHMAFTLPVKNDRNEPVVVRLTMLDGTGELISSATKKDDISSHTSLLMRNPCLLLDGNGANVVRLQAGDLNKMSSINLDYMRLVLNIFEGRVDTELKFEHPEAEHKSPKEKDVIVDLVNELAFFFRSETI